MRYLSLVLLLFTVFCSPLLSDPSWYGNSNSHSVSLKKNIVGYGKALSYEDAVRYAQSDVASQLSVQIKTDITLIDKEQFSSQFQNREKHAHSTIAIHVRQNLYGYQTLKREKKGDYYFVLGVLNKKKYTKTLKSELQKEERGIKKAVNRANLALKQHHFFTSVQLFQETLARTQAFYEKKKIYNVLAHRHYKLKDFYSVAFLKEKLRLLLNGINIVVLKGDMQSIGMGKKLPKPVRFKVTFTNQKYSFPIKKASINLSYSNGKHIDTLLTDNNGEVSFRPLAIPQKNKRFQLVAQLILDDHLEGVSRYENDYTSRVKYRIIDADRPIFYSLEVIAKNMDFMQDLESNLNTQLKNFGLIPSKRPQQLHMKVYYARLDENEIKGPFKLEYLIRGKLILEMYQTDSFVGQLYLIEDGLSHLSVKAEEQLIKKFSLDAETFFNLLNRRDTIKLEEKYNEQARY